MKTRVLGKSDLEITPVGLGAWAIGGSWKFGWGNQADTDSVAAIHRALELGINWIDTAAIYGLGHSEEVVARALAEWPGERPLVFTKCGMIWDEAGNIDYSTRPDSIRREVEASLRRLRAETIDLYQMHWPADDLGETLEGWAEMAKLREEGKVRWIGVSNFSAEELAAASEISPIVSLQPPYSLLRRDIEKEVLPHCRQSEIGVLAYSPMGSGLLSGTMTAERVAALPDDDWRKKSPEFQEPKLSRNLALVERLRELGRRRDAGAGEIAIAWVLRDPAITGAIVGARNADQVDGFAGAAEIRLTPEEIAEIEGD